MKLTYTRLLRLASALAVGVPMLALAAFNSVQLSTGTTFVITLGGSNLEFTVTEGNIQDLEVGASSFTATLADGSTLTLTSNDRRTFNYNAGNAIASFTCGSSSSSLSITLGQGQPDQAISVTPTGVICSTATGGGGGGDGGGAAPAPAPAPAPASASAPAPAPAAAAPAAPAAVAKAPAAVPAAPAVAQPSPVALAVSPVFNKDLQRGSRGDDVKRLQQLLAQDKSIYPEGSDTGYFGPATVRAVKKFQAKYGLPQVGRIGPMTRKKLEEVFKAAPPPAPQAAAPAPVDTKAAQQQLNTLQQKLVNLLKQLKDLLNKPKKSQ